MIIIIFLSGYRYFDTSRYNRSSQSSDDKPYTGNDERYAEPLTHIEEHIGFEGFLVILDEFDEEAAEKYTDEEDPEYQSGAIACTTFPVHIHEQPENSEVTQCFIDLRRVRRFGEDGLCSVSMPHTHIFDKSESQGKEVACP